MGRPPVIAWVLPNLVTLTSLAAGLTALKVGLDGHWTAAIWLIVVAAVLDGLDGRLARRLNASSPFGAQLDNLSDMVVFGVVPAVLLHSWALAPLGATGWAIALLFAICCALRLARFLGMADSPQRRRRNPNYFQGLPAPAAAATALLPMIAAFAFDLDALTRPVPVALWTVLTALLMISTLPVFGFKTARLPRRVRPLALGAAAALATAMLLAPLETLTVAVLIFLATLPLSVALHARHAAHAAPEDDVEDEED